MKPFGCIDCPRRFARQDALRRHEKLHLRGQNSRSDPPTSLVPPAPSLDSMASWDSSSASPVDPALTAATSQSWDEPHPGQHAGIHNVASELDFALIWPDSENLLQSLMSSDTTDQWQMPLGTLPFPPVVQDVNSRNFESPNSFDDCSSSVGTIPSGGGHQAVRNVTEMVTSSVSIASLRRETRVRPSQDIDVMFPGTNPSTCSRPALRLPSRPRPSPQSF